MTLSKPFYIVVSIFLFFAVLFSYTYSTQAAAGELSGYIDYIDYSNELVYNTVNGWAVDPRDRGAPVQVEVMIDRVQSDVVVPTIYRADVAAATGSGFYQGFNYPLPHNLFDGKVHEVRFYTVNLRTGGKTELRNSPLMVQKYDPGVTGFVDTVGVANPQAPEAFVYGWGFDNADFERNVPIVIFEDDYVSGKYLGGGAADLSRPDVDRAYQSGSDHGFAIPLDLTGYESGRVIRVAVYAIDETIGELKRLGTLPFTVR